MDSTNSFGTKKHMVAATMTLRPKDFVRKTVTQRDDPMKTFLVNSLDVYHKGTFNDIDNRCQENQYERFQHSVVLKNEEIERRIAEEEKLFRTQRRIDMLNHTQAVHDEHVLKEKTLRKNHHATQMVKKDRQTQDLHFEQAVQQFRELKTLNDNLTHCQDEIGGVNAFERIMKRSGIGASDGGSGQMTISYEDAKSFNQRLNQMAKETFPSNEEISNFKTQLKERTEENRVARYEKARRRRRAMVDQNKASH